jgi:hypothetical protein
MSFSSSTTPRDAARLSVERLEDRTNPVFLTPNLTGPLTGQINFNGVPQLAGGVSIATGDLYPDNAAIQNGGFVENEYVLGTGPGVPGTIGIFGRAGNLRNTFQPFGNFTGGLNVAVGDVLGDSQAEIIVAPASGALPVVGVYNAQGRLLSGFLAFSQQYTGGLNIAVGNVANGIGGGGFNGGFTTEFADFIFNATGVRPVNRFKQEIVIGTATASSRIIVADGFGVVQRDFFAFDPFYNGGVTVATGSVDKQRDPGFTFGTGQSDTSAYDEIIVGAASVAPLVRVYSVWEGGATMEQSFFAFPPTVGQGVNVAAGQTDNLLGSEIYANLIGTSVVRTFDPTTNENLGQTTVYPGIFSRVLNLTTGLFFGNGFTPSPTTPAGGTVPSTSSYVPVDDDTFFAFTGQTNPLFLIQDLAVVAGDGPLNQQPRLFQGNNLIPAPFSGP